MKSMQCMHCAVTLQKADMGFVCCCVLWRTQAEICTLLSISKRLQLYFNEWNATLGGMADPRSFSCPNLTSVTGHWFGAWTASHGCSSHQKRPFTKDSKVLVTYRDIMKHPLTAVVGRFHPRWFPTVWSDAVNFISKQQIGT